MEELAFHWEHGREAGLEEVRRQRSSTDRDDSQKDLSAALQRRATKQRGPETVSPCVLLNDYGVPHCHPESPGLDEHKLLPLPQEAQAPGG